MFRVLLTGQCGAPDLHLHFYEGEVLIEKAFEWKKDSTERNKSPESLPEELQETFQASSQQQCLEMWFALMAQDLAEWKKEMRAKKRSDS